MSKPVFCTGFEDLSGGGGDGDGERSGSEVTAELTSLGIPEDGGRLGTKGRCAGISESE